MQAMNSAGENSVNSVETATTGPEGLQNRQSHLEFCSRDDAADRKLRPWQRCSVSTTVMGTFICLIWTMWVFLIVLYYTDLVDHSDQVLTADTTLNESSAITTAANEFSDCQSQKVYTGDVCMTVLHTYQSCLAGRNASADADIFISTPSGMSQEEVEAEIVQLLGGLRLLSPSLNCMLAASSFFCRYGFPLCDSRGELYLPSSGECNTLTTEICAREWQTAISILGSENLPQCVLLPADSKQCSQGNEMSFEMADNTSGSITNNSILDCSPGFYHEEGSGVCLPECGVWQLYSNRLETGIKVLMLLLTSVGIAAGIIVLVISCNQYKKMLKFPNSLIVYQTAIVLVNSVTVLISYIDNTALFCTSRNLVESFSNSSPYCTFTGIVFENMYWQLAIWWIFHVLALLWGIRFPFQARSFGVSGRNKYLHMAAILLGLILPWIPIGIILGTGGFEISRFPPIICGVSSRDALFYSTILPIATLDAVGFCLLLVIFWTIWKKQQQHRVRANNHQIGSAEVKALIIVTYYLGIGLYAVVLFGISWQIWPKGRFSTVLRSYLLCESTSPGTCDRSMIEDAILTELMLDAALILLGLLPVVNIIYVVNSREMKKKIQGSTRRLRSLSSFITGSSKISLQTSFT